ncbi:MAG: hypothetical protein OXD45_10710 [Rhodobacteraceae bacterium]|nr:hypothetical protein [Paracoccaceae bacterium]
MDQFNSVWMPLRNVGLGVAKNVSISWDFPINDQVAKINKMAQETQTLAFFEFKNGILSYKIDAFIDGASNWNNQNSNSYGFVLQVTIEKEPLIVQLPDSYIKIVSALVYFYQKLDRLDDLDSVPALIGTLSFRDIGEKSHKWKLEVSFDLLTKIIRGKNVSSGEVFLVPTHS